MSGRRAIRSSRHLGKCPRTRSDAWVMVGQDGGQSIDLGDRALLVFSDTLLMSTGRVDGELPPAVAESVDLAGLGVFRANCAALMDGDDMRAGLEALRFFSGDDGFPAEILPATERERAARLRFWPAHGIRVGADVYVYYVGIETLAPRDPWGFRNAGVGLARVDTSTGRSDRIRADGEWRLWSAGSRDLHFGVQVIEHERHAYVFGSVRHGFDVTAIVARVPIDAIADRDAYEYYDPARERWLPDLARAGSLGPCGSDYSVSFNRYLGRYLMVYVDAFSKRLAVRLAERPEGPYSEVEAVGRLPHAPASDLIYLGFEHPRFARDGGQRVLVSYCEPRFEMSSLLEVRFR